VGIRGIVVLLLLVGGLAAVLLFTDQKPPVQQTAETSVLGGRSLRQCTKMRWQFQSRPVVEVVRGEDGRFHLAEPIVDVASAGYLRQIVDAWDSAQMRATPLADDEAGRKNAGLVQPEVRFWADFADGTRVEVEVGEPGPLTGTRFVRRDGKIWEGSDALVESLRVGLQDLRERSVFRHAFSTAEEVRLEQRLASGKREPLHLKVVEGEWRLLEPVKGRADPVAAQRFVTALVSLTVSDFHAGAMRLPEEEPSIVITVRGRHGEETVRLWEAMGQVYGQIPGRGVTFSSDTGQYGQIFVNAVENLRARLLVPLGGDALEQLVELVVDPGQGRGKRVRLVRDASHLDWRLVEPIEYPARATPCNEVAYALQRLVAREFVDDEDVQRPRANDPRYGLTGERLTVTVKLAAGGVGMAPAGTTTLWFGKEVQHGGEARVYACRSDEPDTVVYVQAEPLGEVRRPWTDFCDRQAVRILAAIERLDLRHKDGTERRFEVTEQGWRLLATDEPRPEVGELANDVLRDLVGQDVVDGNTLGEPDWRIVFARRNGDELGSMSVWDRGAEQPIVVRGPQEAPIGFAVSRRTTSELRALWK
jgi:hypothetical protein